MGLFRRKKDKGIPGGLKSTKRKYLELKSLLDKRPHEFGQADLNRLMNYENKLIAAGKLQPPNLPAQYPQASPQFNMSGQPIHPSQMPYQQAGAEQVITTKIKWGDANKNESFEIEKETYNPVTGEQTKTLGSVVTVGGEVVPADKVGGFCIACNRAVSQQEAVKCSGYEQYGCTKIFCSDHIYYFEDSEGKRIPCCADHYRMRYYYQKV